MSIIVAKLNNGSLIEFDQGKFDKWCVYLTREGCLKYAPKDGEYFNALQKMGSVFGNIQLYNDFVCIYNLTNSKIEQTVINLIVRISNKYDNHKDEICTWLIVIYAGMVAEENKEKAVLKKRIKHLGIYQLLVENASPEYAANFSRGKKWIELDKICRERGF
jgi:hypothetical protein